MEADGIALVTGASRGIGRAVAFALAQRGFEVVASMRKPADGADLVAKAAELGLSLRVERLDVDDPDSISIPDGLRVLVNNAGVDTPNLPLEHTSIAEWRRVFETNVFGLMEVTRRAIPALRASGGGVVCNVTTCSILVPMPFFGLYRASKAAVMAMGESLRTELRPFDIRVLEIMPGAIETDMLGESSTLPEAVQHPEYEALARKTHEMRQAGAGISTPASSAAAAVVNAILESDSPHRVGCDPMSEGLLAAWRGQSDEENMKPMFDAFAPPATGQRESD